MVMDGNGTVCAASLEWFEPDHRAPHRRELQVVFYKLTIILAVTGA